MHIRTVDETLLSFSLVWGHMWRSGIPSGSKCWSPQFTVSAQAENLMSWDVERERNLREKRREEYWESMRERNGAISHGRPGTGLYSAGSCFLNLPRSPGWTSWGLSMEVAANGSTGCSEQQIETYSSFCNSALLKQYLWMKTVFVNVHAAACRWLKAFTPSPGPFHWNDFLLNEMILNSPLPVQFLYMEWL